MLTSICVHFVLCYIFKTVSLEGTIVSENQAGKQLVPGGLAALCLHNRLIQLENESIFMLQVGYEHISCSCKQNQKFSITLLLKTTPGKRIGLKCWHLSCSAHWTALISITGGSTVINRSVPILKYDIHAARLQDFA